MDKSNLEYVVGEVKENLPATIRFFGRITEESTTRFNEEFDFLENVIRPSCIRVLINSEGGSVLYGMSTYSTILNSNVDTECVVEGIAASMASVLWAAGKRSLMRDYGILMIHNPMLPAGGNEDEDCGEMVQAFKNQISTIYRKRFGLKAEKVRQIMNGEAGRDGTYFDAAGAVKAGIIPASHILHTSKQLCEKVQNELKGNPSVREIGKFMCGISAEATLFHENKHFSKDESILNNKHKCTTMNEEKQNSAEYGAVTAALGMDVTCEIKEVISRIASLTDMEGKYKEASKALAEAHVLIAGKEATIHNLQKDLETLTSRIEVYEKKEEAERQARIKKLVSTAQDAGKITAESVAEWETMANTNYELAEKTLASIPGREQISKEIASDPANVKAATDSLKSLTEKITEEVTAVVGENFQFRKLG